MRKDHCAARSIAARRARACCRSCSTAVGLPLRSSTDVVIFAIACMGLNILVGYTGLVSFGHGAWFGLGAYAAALRSATGSRAASCCRRCSRSSSSPSLAALARRPDPAPARRLFLAADAGARPRCCSRSRFRWTEFTGGESGLGGVTRATVLGLDLERDWTITGLVAGDRRSSSPSCCGASTARRSAACWSRSARTSSARASSAIRPTATSSSPSWSRRRVVGARRHAVRLQPPLRLGRAALGRVLGRAARHGGDRRHAQLPRARRSARCSTSCSASSCRSGRRTGCSISACCSSASSCSRRPGSSASRSALIAPFRTHGRARRPRWPAARSADEPLPAFLQPADHARRRRSSRRAASPRASAASRRCRASTSRCATARCTR